MKYLILVSVLFLSFLSTDAQTDRTATRRIMELRDQEKYLDALELADSEIIKHPDDIFLRLLKGNVLRDLERFKEAIEQYDFYISKNAENPAAYGFRGICKAQVGDKKGALADYDRSLQIDPENPIFFYYRGVSRSKNLDYEGAKSDYRNAFNIDTTYYQAFYKLAKIFFEQNEFDSALVYYNKELSIYPDHGQARFERSYSRMSTDDYKGAIQDAQGLVDEGVEDKNLSWIIGMSNLNLDLYQEAARHFDDCIRKDSSDPRVFRARSIARDSLGDYTGALFDLDKCIELNGKFASYYLERGILHLTRMGNIRQALSDYDKAIEVDPGYARAYFVRGFFYGDLYHDAEKACADFKRARSLGYEVDAEIYSQYCK